MNNILKDLPYKGLLLSFISGLLLWSLFSWTGNNIWHFNLPFEGNWRTHAFFTFIVSGLIFIASRVNFAPIDKKEDPAWFYRGARIIIGLWLITMPFIYDKGVAEVGGDLRWQVTHTTVLLLCSMGLFALWQKGKPLALQPKMPLLMWCFAGLIITASISLADTINLYRSWWFYKHFISFIGIAGFVYFLRHPAWYRLLVWLLVLPVGPIAFLAICQFMNFSDAHIANIVGQWWFTIGEPINSYRMVYPQAAIPGGTFSNKNLLASWLVLLWPLTLYVLVTAKTWKIRSLGGIWLSLALVALIFTRSRASWLSFVASVIFLALWVYTQPALRQQVKSYLTWQLGVTFAAVIAVVAFCFPLKSPIQTSYAVNISVQEQVKNITHISDFGPRIAYNINGIKMIMDHPLTGVGIGAFHSAYPMYFNAFYETPRNGYNVEARPQRTHNDLLQAFIEHGILGGLLHLAVIFFILQAAWRLARKEIVATAGIMPAFLITSIMGLCLNSMGDFPFQMPIAPALLFACFGLMAGYARLHNQLPSVGWPKMVSIPKAAVFVLCIVSITTTVLITRESHLRREGAVYLKAAMSRNMQGLFDDHTLNFINKSYNYYQANARMQEYRGIIYSHYNGTKPMPLEYRADVIRESMIYDPHAANQHINLSSTLHKLAGRDLQLGNNKAAVKHLNEIQKSVDKLKIVAPFSHHTWNIAGLLAQRYGQRNEAVKYYLESLKQLNSNPIAMNALRNMGFNVVDRPPPNQRR
ncbi:MAG: O-antigen ligase family protein [Alphaproteobacteria bacterium]|nr:O-antigen ligase family protein [Alphaproteobacteria bacterium]MDD9919256.1 O-antigen ligase family protein [Alphaproteobacteria bacterium]